ncbi:polymeric immunoglobulin receptor isoform X2 [Centroberyx gerrardi]
MPQLLILTLGLLAWIPASLCRVTTVEEHAVLEGRSVTVPCHYEPQYASYVKYWCQGRMRDFCTSLARTDTPLSADLAKEKVSIYDDPVQLVFTVTMTDLKEGDTGWYWCGVEVGGMWSADDAASTYINVIHGMTVVNSRVSGEEGSSVTVECLYSERYRESEKKWCRSGDWSSCLLTGSEGSYDDTSVAISDDRTGAFTVTLKKLQMRDAGWYWCAAGQQQMAVHVMVTPPASTTVSVTSPPTPSQSVAYLSPPKHIMKESWDTHRHIFESVVVCVSLMLLVGMAILARKMWKQHKKEHRQAEELKARLGEYPGEVGDLQNGAVIFLNRDSQNVQMF